MKFLFTELADARKAEMACLRKAHGRRMQTEMISNPEFDLDLVKRNTQGLMVRSELITEIMRSELSVEITYYLAQRVDLIRKLNKLSGRDLTYEIGRIAGLIGRPKVRVKMGRIELN